MPPPDVRVRLSAEGEAQVQAALRRVVGDAQRAGRSASRGFGQFNTTLAGARTLLVQLGAALAVGQLVAFARRATDAADELGKMSQRVGASVQNLSALRSAAATANVEMQTLTTGMVNLSRRVEEFRGGSKDATKDFRALGLTVQDFKGKDAAEQFATIAVAMGKLEDSPGKTALAFQFFGRSAAALIPLLNDVAGAGGLQGVINKARELGLLLSEDTARAAQAINDDFTIIREQVLAGAARFVEGLAPAIHAALGLVQKDLGASVQGWREWGQNVARTVGVLVITIQSLFDRIGTTTAKLGNALGGIAASITALFRGQFREAIAIERETRQRAEELEAEFKRRESERGERAERLGVAVAQGASGLPALRAAGGTEEAPVREAAGERRKQKSKEQLEFESAILAATAGRNAFEAEREAIIERANVGLKSQAAATEEILRLEKERLAVLRGLAAAALSAAQALGDPAAIERALEFGRAVELIALNVEASTNLMARLAATAQDAFKQALTDLFTSGIREAKNFTQALLNVGLAVAQAVQQILAAELATRIVSGLSKLAGGFFSGGQVPVRKAEGGVVSGPGTGTSDSIPARLSRGEFVVRAAVVERPGMLEALGAINRGLHTPVLAGSERAHRFAGGGLVPGAGASRLDTSLTIGLDRGLVLSELQSPEGERAIVRVLSKNRRAAGSALGG